MKSWSYSKLKNYERCPHTLSFPYAYSPPCEAAQRGIDTHAKCEAYINSGGEGPVEGFPWERLNGAHAEVKMGLDKDWRICSYDDAWLKFIPDAFFSDGDCLTIVDFKTGKREYNEVGHSTQMQLYMAAMAAISPRVPLFKAELWYLDQGFVHPTAVYTQQKLVGIRERLGKRVTIMFEDEVLAPKPNKSNCRFCNQPCEFKYEP